VSGALDLARHALPAEPYVVLRARQIGSPSSAKPDICGGGYVRRSGIRPEEELPLGATAGDHVGAAR
jgi:hypothetical protein